MAKDSGREALGGRAVVVALAAVVLLLGGAYAAAGAFASDRVPRGTTVAGVAVGGQTPAQAKQTLADAWQDRVDAPITVTVDGGTTTVEPSEAGLEPALEATVEAAGAGNSWAPDRLWDYWTGGDEVDPVVTVDDERMQTTIQRLDGELGTAPVDGTVTFTGSTVRTTEATTGRVLDDEAVREALVAAYLSEEPTAELDLVEVEPDITDADVEQAVEDYANPALSGPVTLVFGDTPVKLRPADYAKALAAVAGIPTIRKCWTHPDSENPVVYVLGGLNGTIALLTLDRWVLADVNVAILFVFAVSSLEVYGVIMGGWASNSKYPFLGSLRSAAQMISYEVSIGLIIIGVILSTGSMNFGDIVRAQDGAGLFSWYWLPHFPMVFLFLISAMAETNRPPFDLPEAESELVAGYQVEYSSTPFLLFMIGEYVAIVLMCTLVSILFFGGWLSPIEAIPDGALWLILKIFFFFTIFAMVKAITPRYRYDQLMRIGWKVFLPLSLIWVVLVAFFAQYGAFWGTYARWTVGG